MIFILFITFQLQVMPLLDQKQEVLSYRLRNNNLVDTSLATIRYYASYSMIVHKLFRCLLDVTQVDFLRKLFTHNFYCINNFQRTKYCAGNKRNKMHDF